jgi:hypothetical protein
MAHTDEMSEPAQVQTTVPNQSLWLVQLLQFRRHVERGIRHLS